MSTDAIVLLKEDHKAVRKLFRAFESAGDRPPAERSRLVRQIIEELTAHTYIENEVMYPRVRELAPEVDGDVLESYEEHHVADVLCAELALMSPRDERFDAKAAVLINSMRHHMEEEEGERFPKVRAALGRNELQEIGEELLEAKDKAPRTPAHPRALKKAADALFR
jgi:hemerythrin superfamily protein